MHVEYNFELTPRAQAAAVAQGLQSVSFAHGQGAPEPMVGDLFSAELTMPLVFVITRRHLHFVGGEHVQVGLVLDLRYESTPSS